MNKKKTLRRELIEWGVFLGIIAGLYLTGLHTPVFGFLQGLVLQTGLFRPSVLEDAALPADYSFNLIDRQGRPLSFEEFRGKVVFVNFWATWCPPCVAEMPDIHRLYERIGHEPDIAFAMIALDEDFGKALSFLDKKGFTFPVYRPGSALPPDFQSTSIPTTFLLGKDGRIVSRKAGMAKYNTESFRSLMLRLAAE
jgi:thiol-disulfide isomerase/thioredoxin